MRTSIVIIAFTSILVFSCSSKEMRRAKELIENEQFEEAIKLLDLEITYNPDNPKAYYLLGTCQYKENYSDDLVLENFNKAIELDEVTYREEIGRFVIDEYIKTFPELVKNHLVYDTWNQVGQSQTHLMSLKVFNIQLEQIEYFWPNEGGKVFFEEILNCSKEIPIESNSTPFLLQFYLFVLEHDSTFISPVISITREMFQSYYDQEDYLTSLSLLSFIGNLVEGSQEYAKLGFDVGEKLYVSKANMEEAFTSFDISLKQSDMFNDEIADYYVKRLDMMFEQSKNLDEINTSLNVPVRFSEEQTMQIANMFLERGKKGMTDEGKSYEVLPCFKKAMDLNQNANKEIENHCMEILTNGSSSNKNALIFAAKVLVELDNQRLDEINRLLKDSGSKVSLMVDKRDGKTYKVKRFGKDVWFVENLKYITPKRREGISFHVFGVQSFSAEEIMKTDSYNIFGAAYGYPYNASQPTCPEDWHVPSAEEWNALKQYLKPLENKIEYIEELGLVDIVNSRNTSFPEMQFYNGHYYNVELDFNSHIPFWVSTKDQLGRQQEVDVRYRPEEINRSGQHWGVYYEIGNPSHANDRYYLGHRFVRCVKDK